MKKCKQLIFSDLCKASMLNIDTFYKNKVFFELLMAIPLKHQK